MMLNVFSPRSALRLLIGGKSVRAQPDARDSTVAALARQRLALADAMQAGSIGGEQAAGLAADLDRMARLMARVGANGRLTSGLRSYIDAELARHGEKLTMAAHGKRRGALGLFATRH